LSDSCINIISSIDDIETIRKINNNHKNVEISYRGQSFYGWDLHSSFYRSNGKLSKEQLKIKKDILKESKSCFEIISKMQHYGIPTKFIDFTTSLDVALFFACSEKTYENDDGALFVDKYVDSYKPNWRDTVIISNFALLDFQEKNQIKVKDFISDVIKNNEIEGDVDELSMYFMSYADYGFMIIPTESQLEDMKTSNPRMYRQRGCFFATGTKFINRIEGFMRSSMYAANNIMINQESTLLESSQKSKSLRKIKIPSKLKQEILIYLQGKNITKEYLMCYDDL